MLLWDALGDVDFLRNQRGCINDTHRTVSMWESRFYQARSRKLCWSRAAELSFDNIHTLISNLHISGDRRKLNPIGSIAGTLFHSAFFIEAEIKAVCQKALWLICRFCLFPAGLRKTKSHDSIEMAVTHARGGMNVFMQWDFDTGKRMLDAELTHKSLYDMVIILLKGYLFIPWVSLAPFKSFYGVQSKIHFLIILTLTSKFWLTINIIFSSL